MSSIKKSILMGLLMVWSIGSFAWNPPTIQCIKLLNNNSRIHIDWESNPDCLQFIEYRFYVNGVLCESLMGTPTDTLYNHGGIDIENIPSAINNQYNCYIIAIDSNNYSYQSDTLQSINLTVQVNTYRTTATLNWEHPTNNYDDTWGSTFTLYKKRGFETEFQPFKSIPISQSNYTDISDVCNDSISYQVSISHFYTNSTIQTQCPFMTTICTVTDMVDSLNPAVPVLDSVTVTPDNRVMLGFHKNETEPPMMAFVIYCENVNGWPPYDTVYGNGVNNFWIDPVIDPSNNSRFYRIAAMDSCGNIGEMIATDNKQCNMILQLKSTNACQRSASIQWSTYTNLINDINHFEVMLSGDNGMTWENRGSTTGNNFVIDNLEYNRDYIAYVRVVNNGATVTASTNRININIEAEVSTDFTYIQSVSVIDNQFIQIKVLTSGDTLPFETITLLRSENGTDFEPFKTQNYANGTASYVFYDSLADFGRKTYFYRTFVINHCFTDAGYSNISHNILLRGENNAQTNYLSWQSYDNWDGGVSDYYVMRKVENEELFNAIANLPPSSVNNYSDDISQLFESGSKFLYYIEAKESPNQYGIEETSYSNIITVIQPPTLYIPNAFRPLGTNNNVFKPTNSFVSIENYKFSIFTRTGECIFMTTNPQEGWNGRINGAVAPMNVYVYYIEYMMPDGTVLERTGTVTLIR